ncbi:MAG: hypothetical protein ACPGLV_07145 [Bacteroidia bacterium]
MKFAFITAIFIAMILSCKSDNDRAFKSVKIPASLVDSINDCEGVVSFKTQANSDNLGRLMDLLRKISEDVKFVDTVLFQDGLVTLKLPSGELGQEFYQMAGLMEYNWQYCQYHSIYSAFFFYTEVQGVKLEYEDDNITLIPCKGEYDAVIPEGGVMKRIWYVAELDYAQALDRDNPSIYHDLEARIIKSSILDSLATANSIKRK